MLLIHMYPECYELYLSVLIKVIKENILFCSFHRRTEDDIAFFQFMPNGLDRIWKAVQTVQLCTYLLVQSYLHKIPVQLYIIYTFFQLQLRCTFVQSHEYIILTAQRQQDLVWTTKSSYRSTVSEYCTVFSTVGV